MSTPDFFTDPDLGDLGELDSREVLETVYAIEQAGAERLARATVELAVPRQAMHVARTNLNGALKNFQSAMADLVEFTASVGAQAVQASLIVRVVVMSILLLGGAAESAFAFNGVRWALGDVGAIDHPWDDPLALLGAAVIGGLSVLLAKKAAAHFAWAERSVMHEPIRAELAHGVHTPQAVKADESNLELTESLPLVADEMVLYVDDLDEDPVVPESDEVQAEKRNRHKAVFRSPRSRKIHLLIAASILTVGLGIWTVNGHMRGDYASHLPKPATASGVVQATGLAAAKPVASSKPKDSGVSESAIVLMSIFIFLASVLIAYASSPATQLRAKELKGNVKTTRKDAQLALQEAKQVLLEYEQAAINIELAKTETDLLTKTARLPEDT